MSEEKFLLSVFAVCTVLAIFALIWTYGARPGEPDALCPAVGSVVRPEGTPEEVCGGVEAFEGVYHDEAARCWSVVTAAWERYYQCGRARPGTDGGFAP